MKKAATSPSIARRSCELTAPAGAPDMGTVLGAGGPNPEEGALVPVLRNGSTVVEGAFGVGVLLEPPAGTVIVTRQVRLEGGGI